MAFDEEPDDPHGECRAEIERLQRVLDEGCNLDYEEGLLKDNARLRAEIARLNAESEARHQSRLVLMKSVTDHRAEIERLTADEREACAAVESARAWMREYGEEADRLRAALEQIAFQTIIQGMSPSLFAQKVLAGVETRELAREQRSECQQNR